MIIILIFKSKVFIHIIDIFTTFKNLFYFFFINLKYINLNFFNNFLGGILSPLLFIQNKNKMDYKIMLVVEFIVLFFIF